MGRRAVGQRRVTAVRFRAPDGRVISEACIGGNGKFCLTASAKAVEHIEVRIDREVMYLPPDRGITRDVDIIFDAISEGDVSRCDGDAYTITLGEDDL